MPTLTSVLAGSFHGGGSSSETSPSVSPSVEKLDSLQLIQLAKDQFRKMGDAVDSLKTRAKETTKTFQDLAKLSEKQLKLLVTQQGQLLSQSGAGQSTAKPSRKQEIEKMLEANQVRKQRKAQIEIAEKTEKSLQEAQTQTGPIQGVIKGSSGAHISKKSAEEIGKQVNRKSFGGKVLSTFLGGTAAGLTTGAGKGEGKGSVLSAEDAAGFMQGLHGILEKDLEPVKASIDATSVSSDEKNKPEETPITLGSEKKEKSEQKMLIVRMYEAVKSGFTFLKEQHEGYKKWRERIGKSMSSFLALPVLGISLLLKTSLGIVALGSSIKAMSDAADEGWEWWKSKSNEKAIKVQLEEQEDATERRIKAGLDHNSVEGRKILGATVGGNSVTSILSDQVLRRRAIKKKLIEFDEDIDYNTAEGRKKGNELILQGKGFKLGSGFYNRDSAYIDPAFLPKEDGSLDPDLPKWRRAKTRSTADKMWRKFTGAKGSGIPQNAGVSTSESTSLDSEKKDTAPIVVQVPSSGGSGNQASITPKARQADTDIGDIQTNLWNFGGL